MANNNNNEQINLVICEECEEEVYDDTDTDSDYDEDSNTYRSVEAGRIIQTHANTSTATTNTSLNRVMQVSTIDRAIYTPSPPPLALHLQGIGNTNQMFTRYNDHYEESNLLIGNIDSTLRLMESLVESDLQRAPPMETSQFQRETAENRNNTDASMIERDVPILRMS